MLAIFRRHTAKCRKAHGNVDKGRDYRRCRCPLHVEGSLNGAKIRQALDLTSWEAAERKVRDWEIAGTITKPLEAPLSVAEAVRKFLAYAHSRNLSKPTLNKFTLILTQLKDFCESRNIAALRDVNFELLVEFQTSWSEKSEITKAKKLERLRSFFRFFHDGGVIPSNPARGLKPGKAKPVPKDPYSDAELERIDQSLAKDPNQKLAVFEKVLRFSALRISDVAMLRPEHLDGNKIYLNTQKTGKHVGIPLPPFTADAMRSLPLNGGFFFLHGNSTRHETQTDYWRDELNKIFKEAKVDRAHPHRYRANAAVRWLVAGLDIADVASYLGNSVKIVEKHYLSWCQKRADRAEEILKATWKKTHLVRVK